MSNISFFLMDIGRAFIIVGVLYGLAVVGIIANANRYNRTREPHMPPAETFLKVKVILISYFGLFIGAAAMLVAMICADLVESCIVLGLAYIVFSVLLFKKKFVILPQDKEKRL